MRNAWNWSCWVNLYAGVEMGFDFTLPGLGKPESSRPKRAAEAIRHELTILLRQKAGDPLLRDVNILNVVMSPDMGLAKIYFDLPAGQEPGKALKGLNRAKGFFRSHLARQLNMRYTPDLAFYHDKYAREAERLEHVFEELAGERRADEDPE